MASSPQAPGLAEAGPRPRALIKPTRRWHELDLRELWGHRDLLVVLALRDLQLRYKQTLLGVCWAVIQPLVPMLLFAVVLGNFLSVPGDGVPYPLFAYAGLVLWSYFAGAVTASANSLVSHSYMLGKVYFPRLILPCAPVLSGLADFAIASVLLLGMMLWYGVPLTPALALVPVVAAVTALLAFAVGALLASLNVLFRDLRHALPLAVQLWMFATPIVYPPSVVPARWRWALALNPAAGLVGAFRAALFGLPVAWDELAAAAAAALALLAVAAVVFLRMERFLADYA